MKKILTASFTYILVVGIISVVIYKTSNINLTYLTYTTAYSPTGMYIFDVYGYTQGLSRSFNSILGIQFLAVPEMPQVDWSTVEKAIKSVANILILDINSIICTINIIICPIKFIIYIIFVCMALLGYHTNYDSVINTMQQIYSLQLPYFNYL